MFNVIVSFFSQPFWVTFPVGCMVGWGIRMSMNKFRRSNNTFK